MTQQDNQTNNDSVSRRSLLVMTSAALVADEGHERRHTHRDQRETVGTEEPRSGAAGAEFGVSAGDRCGWMASVLVVNQAITIVCLSIFWLGAVL
jgi:hypothetical protein